MHKCMNVYMRAQGRVPLAEEMNKQVTFQVVQGLMTPWSQR